MITLPDLRNLKDIWALRDDHISQEFLGWLLKYDHFFCGCGWTESIEKPSLTPTCKICGKIMKKREVEYEKL